ncbi:MAG: UDP-3-O-(3-hydroxymyristoyl)glucosamine N-acyltransferase [Planctomycetota bacterium]
MSVRLAKLAELVGGTLYGDGQREITGASTIRDVTAGGITLADNPAFFEQLRCSDAEAVVVSREGALSESFPDNIMYITVDNVREAFATIVNHFRPQQATAWPGISPAAHIHPTAKIADDVTIMPGCVIGESVVIESGVTLHPNVSVMSASRIGAGSTIFPGVTLYENTQIGERVIIHANAVLGAHGFGYEMQDGRHAPSPQLGNVVVHDDVEIGAATTIDRGTYGPTEIGEGTKIDNQVMIGHNCRIGKHNLLCANVGIAGSCTTGDYVVMAGQVGLRDHVDIASGVMLGAKAGVSESLTEAGKYLGAPAVPLRQEIQCLMARQKLPELRKLVKRLERQLNSRDERDRNAA